MGPALAMLVAVTSSLAVPISRAEPIESTSRRLDRLLFATPLPNFVEAARHHGPDDGLDWSTDLCSAPIVGNSGLSFDFGDACRRHDFGYRNAKRIPGRWTPSFRRLVDEQFHRDMTGLCDLRHGWEKSRCRAWAAIFYRAVRLAGGP